MRIGQRERKRCQAPLATSVQASPSRRQWSDHESVFSARRRRWRRLVFIRGHETVMSGRSCRLQVDEVGGEASGRAALGDPRRVVSRQGSARSGSAEALKHRSPAAREEGDLGRTCLRLRAGLRRGVGLGGPTGIASSLGLRLRLAVMRWQSTPGRCCSPFSLSQCAYRNSRSETRSTSDRRVRTVSREASASTAGVCPDADLVHAAFE